MESTWSSDRSWRHGCCEEGRELWVSVRQNLQENRHCRLWPVLDFSPLSVMPFPMLLSVLILLDVSSPTT